MSEIISAILIGDNLKAEYHPLDNVRYEIYDILKKLINIVKLREY